MLGFAADRMKRRTLLVLAEAAAPGVGLVLGWCWAQASTELSLLRQDLSQPATLAWVLAAEAGTGLARKG